jgi:hypothetical protein
MNRFGAFIIVAALAGCASTQEALQRPVTHVFHSTQSMREVAFCLADRNHTPALERDDGSRVVLIKNGYGAVSLAFTIYSEGTGSRIEYRRIFGTIGGAWRRCIGPEAESWHD